MVERYNSNRINCSFIFIVLAALSINMQVRASCDCHDVLEPTQVDTYTFITGQSCVIQTGGFAGANEKYHVEGQFQLYIDSNEEFERRMKECYLSKIRSLRPKRNREGFSEQNIYFNSEGNGDASKIRK